MYTYVHLTLAPCRRRHFFMMYTTRELVVFVCACSVCLKGLPDATSITPISFRAGG